MKSKLEVLLPALALPAVLALALWTPDRNSGVSLQLLHAAGAADPQTVERLIEAGADVNARDSMGMTPLHWAAYRGRMSTIQMLLDQGADPAARNGDNDTPAMVAAARNRDRHSRLIEGYERQQRSRMLP